MHVLAFEAKHDEELRQLLDAVLTRLLQQSTLLSLLLALMVAVMITYLFERPLAKRLRKI